MTLRELVRSESSAFIDRIVSAADEQVARARAEASKDGDTLRAQLEEQLARATALETDLDAVVQAHSEVEGQLRDALAERTRAEQELAGLRPVLDRARELEGELRDAAAARGRAEQELAGVRELLERARAEAAQLGEARDSEAAQRVLLQEAAASARESSAAAVAQAHAEVERTRAALESDLRSARAALASLQEILEELRPQLEAATAERDMLRTGLDSATEEREVLTARLHALGTEHAALTTERDALMAQELSTSDAMEAVRVELRRAQEQARSERDELATALVEMEARLEGAQHAAAASMAASIRAIEALTACATLDDVLAALTREAQQQAPRVAIFRAKGNHLEGERGAGPDGPLDMKKLMLPMSVDSLVTRAVSSGMLVRSGGDQLERVPPPIGGTAIAAVAVPLTMNHEPFGVLYVDADREITDAQADMVQLLGKQGSLVLATLSEEIRTQAEMREYAAMLISEAEQMFASDVQSGRAADEQVSRLRVSIDCARQLFAQRATLEGCESSTLLEHQLASASAQRSPFGEAIAAVVGSAERQRTA